MRANVSMKHLVLHAVRDEGFDDAAHHLGHFHSALNDGPMTLPSAVSLPWAPPSITCYHSGTVLVHAQHADVAHVVVAARTIDAAGDVRRDLARVVHEVEVVQKRSWIPSAIGIELGIAPASRNQPPGQAMMSVSRPMLAVARPACFCFLPEGEEVVLLHVRRHQVLLVRHAQLAKPVAVLARSATVSICLSVGVARGETGPGISGERHGTA